MILKILGYVDDSDVGYVYWPIPTRRRVSRITGLKHQAQNSIPNLKGREHEHVAERRERAQQRVDLLSHARQSVDRAQRAQRAQQETQR